MMVGTERRRSAATLGGLNRSYFMAESKSRLEIAATTVQVLSVVVGVVISVLSWHSTATKDAEARVAEASARQVEARRYSDQRSDIAREQRAEAAKPFLELRQNLYLQALRAAGVLANPDVHSTVELERARKRFTELYVAELSMVEARDVEGQMVDLARAIDPGLLSMTQGQLATYKLAHAIRDSLVRSWGVDQQIATGEKAPESKP